MRKLAICLAVLSLFAAPALADEYCYSWENGGTMLGAYLPQIIFAENSTAQARTGTHSLEYYEIADPISGSWSGTPQAYVAWVTGLTAGDVITASVYVWDDTPGANPSCRIWGHWTAPGGDINSYLASASGNGTYSNDLWATALTYTWTVTSAQEGAGLVIEIRSYSGATGVGKTNYIDDLCVTIPERAGVELWFPDSVVRADQATWGSLKNLYK